jgi:two-component system, OmpR family, response regulator
MGCHFSILVVRLWFCENINDRHDRYFRQTSVRMNKCRYRVSCSLIVGIVLGSRTKKGGVMAASLLIVDDDPTFRNLLTFVLKQEGHSVETATSAAEMHARIAGRRPNLLLLDLGLPDEDGIVLLRQIVARSGPAVIVITGRTDQEMVLTALEIGAADYITKPFDPREVIMRVRLALSRAGRTGRANDETGDGAIRFDGWTLDRRARSLRDPRGLHVPLTAGEFNLLAALLAHPGWSLSRDQLLDAISSSDDPPSPRMVDVFVAQLRAKIDSGREGPSLIHTVRGHGYRFGGTLE